MTVNQVTKGYREARKLSLRKFSEAINENLINTGMSHTQVARLELKTKYHEPDPYLLFECMEAYRDWRRAWAADCLKAMFPNLFETGVVRIELPTAQ